MQISQPRENTQNAYYANIFSEYDYDPESRLVYICKCDLIIPCLLYSIINVLLWYLVILSIRILT